MQDKNALEGADLALFLLLYKKGEKIVNFKKIKSIALSAMIGLGCMSITQVQAKTADVYSEFDTSHKGSITLYKYVSNDKGSDTTDGTAYSQNPADQLDDVTDATGNYKMIPEKGVNFAYYKIAELEQIKTNSDTGFYYTNINENYLSLLNQYGVTLTPSATTTDRDSGKSASEKHYPTSSLNKTLSELINKVGTDVTGETAIRNLLTTQGTKFDSTNSYGMTEANDLDCAVYLVAEIDWENQMIVNHNDSYWERVGDENAIDGETTYVVSPSSPFIMTIPTSNTVAMTSNGKTYEPGAGWIYDVTAYPKNGTISIHKDIITNDLSTSQNNTGMDTVETETLCTLRDGDGLTHQIDASYGDTVEQLVTSDVPVLQGNKKNKTYKISDEMTEGLTFDKILSVKLGTKEWNSSDNQTLTPDVDYIVTSNEHGFEVTLTSSGLLKLDAIQEKSYLYVQYDIIFNHDALLGTDKTADGKTNQNKARLTYATDRTSEHSYDSNETKVYSYRINLLKTFKGENKDYSKVSFSATRTYSGGVHDEVTDVNWVKEADGVYHMRSDLDGNAKTTNVLIPDSEGNIWLKGLDSADYTFTELTTAEGSQLLTEPFTIRLVAHKQSDSYTEKYEDGSLQHAYAWSGEEPAKLKTINETSNPELAEGTAKFELSNLQTLGILRTGGSGIGFLMIGVGIMLIGYSIYSRNKREVIENE